MAVHSVTMYPFVRVGADGQFKYVNAYSWETDSKIESDGGIIIRLPPVEVKFAVPDELRPQALELLRKHRTDLKAAHQKLLTQLQFTENQLLGLAAPEVLDAVEKPPGRIHFGDERDDDDIPF